MCELPHTIPRAQLQGGALHNFVFCNFGRICVGKCRHVLIHVSFIVHFVFHSHCRDPIWGNAIWVNLHPLCDYTLMLAQRFQLSVRWYSTDIASIYFSQVLHELTLVYLYSQISHWSSFNSFGADHCVHVFYVSVCLVWWRSYLSGLV